MFESGSQLRVWAGKTKFVIDQAAAYHFVSTYRRVHRISTPVSERILYVHAHPRSGSTLLGHLLHANPQIDGFGEHHVSYRTPEDVTALQFRTAFHARDPKLSTKYVYDKIVWNHNEVADELLNADRARSIFLVREPVATVASYRKMFPNLTTDRERFEAYTRRLNGMIELAARVEGDQRGFFLSYADLINNSDRTLTALSDFLELDIPLVDEYEVTSKTGVQSWGDPSETIKAGRIVVRDASVARLDADLAAEATSFYGAASTTLAAMLGSITERAA